MRYWRPSPTEMGEDQTCDYPHLPQHMNMHLTRAVPAEDQLLCNLLLKLSTTT